MLSRLENLLVRPIRARSAYLFLLAVSATFVAPILFAGVDYIDDTSRKLEGSYQWGSLGRIATEGLMHILTFNFGTMTDPGNLMQLLCIPSLALTAYIIAKMFSNNGKLSVSSLLVGMQVIPNQLLLTNVSFRFDSLSMVLGSLAAVYAAYVFLFEPRHRNRGTLASIVLIFLAASFYQSTILMFGVVVIVVLVARYAGQSREKIYPLLLRAMGVFVVGSLLYMGMTRLFQFSSLLGDRQDLVPFSGAGLHMALDNLQAGLKTVMLFVSNMEAFVLAAVVAAVLGISLALVIYNYVKKRSVIDTVVVGLSPLLVTLLIMGPFVLLQGSQLTTQVRVLTSVIGMMLLTVAIILGLYKTGRRWALWLLAAPLLMNLYSIGFAYTYGSTLKAQRIADETVYESIVALIQSDPKLQNASTIFIGGKPASPLTVTTQFDKRPALKRMNIADDNSRWYIWNRLKDERIGDTIELYSGKHSSLAVVKAICSHRPALPQLKTQFYKLYMAWDGVYVLWLQDHLTVDDPCDEV